MAVDLVFQTQDNVLLEDIFGFVLVANLVFVPLDMICFGFAAAVVVVVVVDIVLAALADRFPPACMDLCHSAFYREHMVVMHPSGFESFDMVFLGWVFGQEHIQAYCSFVLAMVDRVVDIDLVH